MKMAIENFYSTLIDSSGSRHLTPQTLESQLADDPVLCFVIRLILHVLS